MPPELLIVATLLVLLPVGEHNTNLASQASPSAHALGIRKIRDVIFNRRARMTKREGDCRARLVLHTRAESKNIIWIHVKSL